jgi:hypothetical protein
MAAAHCSNKFFRQPLNNEKTMAHAQNSGQCLLCKETFKEAGMTRHFAKCLETHKAADGKFFHVAGAWRTGMMPDCSKTTSRLT